MTIRVPKPSKWFSNKVVKLNLNRPHPSKSSSSSTTLSSPMATTPKESERKLVDHDEFKEVFRYFDSDGDGKISALELRAYFGSIGEYMSYEEAQGAIDDLDTDGDSLLDFQDFLKLMKREGDDDNHHQDLKKAFEMFELEKKGCITPKGLQKMLHRLGDVKSYDQCVAMIQVYDIDGNGVLDFHEFYQMMA